MLDPAKIAQLDAACVDSDRALHAFYGRGNTVRALIGTGERPQEICTPPEIIEGLLRLWPEGIQLDPCSGPDSIVPARVRYCVPKRTRTVQKKRKGTLVTVAEDYYEAQPGDTDGLTLPWAPFCYVNFPFADMSAWLQKAAGEPREQVLLCPVRTSRNSYVDALERCDQVIWLHYAIRFIGYKDAFPQALSLLYRGDRDAERAFAHIGRRARIR